MKMLNGWRNGQWYSTIFIFSNRRKLSIDLTETLKNILPYRFGYNTCDGFLHSISWGPFMYSWREGKGWCSE